MKEFTVTDIIGQPHVFTVPTKKVVDGKEQVVPNTVRLNSRKSVTIEAEELPAEIAQEEKLGFVLVESSVKTSKKSGSKKDEVE